MTCRINLQGTFPSLKSLRLLVLQEQANKEAKAAAEAVSSNPKELSGAALRKEINERDRKCKDMLHQHRFIRQTASRSGHTATHYFLSCGHTWKHPCPHVCLGNIRCGLQEAYTRVMLM